MKPSIGELRIEAEIELMRRRRDYSAKVARKRMDADAARRKILLMTEIVAKLRELEKAELLV